jgi:hypothetical protein
MTQAKELAKELVEKYYHLFSVELENTIADYEAKECALIAVDELIKETGSKYWYDVKLEIEKL